MSKKNFGCVFLLHSVDVSVVMQGLSVINIMYVCMVKPVKG